MIGREPLPSQPIALARICQISLEKWQEHEQTIIALLIPKGGRFHMKRCDIELDRQDSKSNKLSEAAEKSHEARRKNKQNQNDISQGNAKPIAEERRGEKEQKVRKEKEAGVVLPDWLSADIWSAYVAHRKFIKKPISAHAQSLAIIELGGFIKNGHDPTTIINTSISKGWIGLFEPKTNQNGSRSQPTKQSYSDMLGRVAEKAVRNLERETSDEIY